MAHAEPAVEDNSRWVDEEHIWYPEPELQEAAVAAIRHVKSEIKSTDAAEGKSMVPLHALELFSEFGQSVCHLLQHICELTPCT